MRRLPLNDFSSGYFQRASFAAEAGHESPWRLRQNYIVDRIGLEHGRLDDGAIAYS